MQRSRSLRLDLVVTAEIDDVGEPQFLDQVLDRRRREVLQVVGAEQPARAERAAVRGRQTAQVAHVDDPVQVEPVDGGAHPSPDPACRSSHHTVSCCPVTPRAGISVTDPSAWAAATASALAAPAAMNHTASAWWRSDKHTSDLQTT